MTAGAKPESKHHDHNHGEPIPGEDPCNGHDKAVAVGQPALTLVNVAISVALAATAWPVSWPAGDDTRVGTGRQAEASCSPEVRARTARTT